MRSWYEPLRAIQSKGSQAERPGSLAGLANARAIHEGQFFTPDALCAWLWGLADRVIEEAVKSAVRLSRSASERPIVALWDNSIGSGRLMQFADPEKHAIYGCDVDVDAVTALSKALAEAKFKFDIEAVGMEEVRAHSMDVALINPPFSLTLSSPQMERFSSSAFGRFGPNTSSLSHLYAIEQALSCSSVVFAIVPATFAEDYFADAKSSSRLRALYRLPAGLFRSEGTDVRVSVLAFTSYSDYTNKGKVAVDVVSLDDRVDVLPVKIDAFHYRPKVHKVGIDHTEPTITLPVTGDKRVHVSHDGREIKLKFGCGLTQAKVLNAVYEEVAYFCAAEGHRLPKGIRYTGQGLLDIEYHVAQNDPVESFRAFLKLIRRTGSTPKVDAGVENYLKRRVKQYAREKEPYRHVVRGVNPNKVTFVTGVAKQDHLLDRNSWVSPRIKRGQTFVFTPSEGATFTYIVNEQQQTITRDELVDRFDVTWPSTDGGDAGWYVAHEGRAAKFPEVADYWRRRATRLGVDKLLSWEFQFNDAIELMIAKKGGVVAWQQGAGKARLSIALCLLGSDGPGLITMPAHLVLETAREITNKLALPADQWQIIDTPEKLTSLKRINLISLTRLRMPVDSSRPKMTYAKRLRRRVKVMVADEGELLANTASEQTKAIEQVSAKRMFTLSGTPIANYPRNILPLLQVTGGDGTAAQRYGRYHGFLEPNLIRAQQYAKRGVDAFRESFVVMEWSTNEFKEDLVQGAKREVPKISNLDAYRKAVAPFVLRRLIAEPDVSKYVNIPVPTKVYTDVPWDAKHLGLYLKTAHEFANWFRKARGDDGKNLNLIALLARIGAVVMAGNNPQRGSGLGYISGLTSKQRAVLKRLTEWTNDGRKSIMFAHNPDVVDLMHAELNKRGIDSVRMHGGITIKQRTKMLDEDFRYGDTPVLLASYAVAQSGYNLPQASRVAMYSRDWRHKVEDQAIARTLRFDQKEDVLVEYFHLRGGIDEYQRQMVDFKADAASAGLDWATPQNDDVEFLHLDTILGRFVEGLIPKGVSISDYYRSLLASDERVEDMELESTW